MTQKTKYPHFTRNKNHIERSLQIEENEFDLVDRFKYLVVSNQNTDEPEIQKLDKYS